MIMYASNKTFRLGEHQVRLLVVYPHLLLSKTLFVKEWAINMLIFLRRYFTYRYCQVFVSLKDITLFKRVTTNDIISYIILTNADLTVPFDHFTQELLTGDWIHNLLRVGIYIGRNTKK
jgi:hypothetical protein